MRYYCCSSAHKAVLDELGAAAGVAQLGAATRLLLVASACRALGAADARS